MLTRWNSEIDDDATYEWISGIVWFWAWCTILLEIFRWKHVTPSLRFSPGPPLPGTDLQPQPGLPLIALYVACVVAPIVFVAVMIIGRVRAKASRTT